VRRTVPGRLITLEGIEGCGKSTQALRLAAALAAAGCDVLRTREPGGSPGAEAIRGVLLASDVALSPLSEALLHYAARRDHLDRTILPALAAGRWVVCDRFADSTMAYQGFGHGLGRQPIERLHALVVGDLTPDLTLILDLEVTAGLARARQRSPAGDRYERLDAAFHARVRGGFRDIAGRAPERCAVVTADADVETVAARIRAVVSRRLEIAL